MLRLAAVFLIWIASTAWALDDFDANYDAELHEAYLVAWSEADDHQRRLLERAQRGWKRTAGLRYVLRPEKSCASATGSRLARRTCGVLGED